MSEEDRPVNEKLNFSSICFIRLSIWLGDVNPISMQFFAMKNTYLAIIFVARIKRETMLLMSKSWKRIFVYHFNRGIGPRTLRQRCL